MADPIPWLLEAGEPWVRYRTLLDLLDRSEDDSEVEAARRDMVEHPKVRELIAEAVTWPGYPLKRHNDAQHPLHKLAFLADFGLRADDPGMDKLISAVMGRQSHEGAFQTVTVVSRAFGGTDEEAWTWMLCDAPTVLYSLLSFGLGDQPAVQRAVEHLTALIRDNGWPCAVSPSLGKFRGPGRKDDPCPYANLVALKALAHASSRAFVPSSGRGGLDRGMPELRDSPVTRTGIEMLLRHWERQTESKLYMFGIGSDFRKLKYPFIWYDILHVTDVLSRFPFARQDSRLQEMVKVISDKQDGQGRFTPESVWMAWKAWDFGQKRNLSPSVTLLVRRVLKRMGT